MEHLQNDQLDHFHELDPSDCWPELARTAMKLLEFLLDIGQSTFDDPRLLGTDREVELLRPAGETH